VIKAENHGGQISGGELLAASGTTTSQNLTAVFGGHAGAEAVGAFTLQNAGLECSFHDITT
jgi:hypothetical protein